jgi:GT2 family glycosyltransferase
MQTNSISMTSTGSPKILPPRVTVIVVTYCSSKEFTDCVESVLRQSVPTEVFLVDNASPDKTGQMVVDYAARLENVRAILNQRNLGLAAGNNAALGSCRGDYVLILNPDTLLCENTLSQLVDFLDINQDVGVVGPKNLYADGRPHSSFHKNWGFLHVFLWRILPFRFTRSCYDRFSSYKFQDPLFVSGACLLIRRSIFEQIEGYDPEYFLTVEDACDLCIRARETGCRVVFLPDAEVIHLGGRSAAHAPYVVVWQGYRGTLYHFWKHKGITQALLVLALLLMSSGLRALIAATLGIFNEKYRNIARIYARVCWRLLLHSRMTTMAWRFSSSVSPGERSG